MGMTSSDILDTSLALLLKEAGDILIEDIDGLFEILKKQAFQHKNNLMIGRSHGIHAEPITFGLKLALWYDEMMCNRARLVKAKEGPHQLWKDIPGGSATFAFISNPYRRRVAPKIGN